jgi:transposase-like protein
MPELIRILVNAAMQAERQKHLGAGPYERTPERQGYANGYKPKTVRSRVGSITFDIPQVRAGIVVAVATTQPAQPAEEL